MALIFVDCEGHGPAPGLNNESKFEFGAVELKTRKEFYGAPGCAESDVLWHNFQTWLHQFNGRLVFVTDNVAYDWQFINYYFHKWIGINPFGHSARRIGDFAAGLRRDFYAKQDWKRLRRTKHDHHPVHDALGNVEAFERLCNGEMGNGDSWRHIENLLFRAYSSLRQLDGEPGLVEALLKAAGTKGGIDDGKDPF